jgi:Leucine-rich repeat (LRR) protein
MEPQPAIKSKAKRRRWLQYTLRSLAVFMVLVSFPLAWIGNELASKRREDEIADVITKSDGRAVYSEVNRFHIPVRIDVPWISDDPFGEESWTEEYRLTHVELNRSKPAEFRSLLAHLKDLQYLRELDLSYTRVCDADLQELQKLTKLTDLDLSETRVEDEGIDNILRLPNLHKLVLDYTHITDAGLKKLASLSGLQELELTGTQVTEQGIAKLIVERPDLHVTCKGHLPSEREVIAARGLRLLGWRVDFWDDDSNGPIYVTLSERKADLSNLELDCLTSLKKLDLTISTGAPSSINAVLPDLHGLEGLQSYNELNGGELRRLTRCQNLKRLILWRPTLSEQDWATFREFPNLETLGLSPATITSHGIEDIAKAKNLTSLSLYGGHFRPQDLVPLTTLEGLNELRLQHAKFEPGATQTLGDLKNLAYLNLHGSNFYDADLVSLLHLKNLVALNVDYTEISDPGLLRLAEIKSLKELKVFWSKKVTGEGKKQFSKLRPDVELD